MFYDNAWSIQQKCRMGGTDMCVGLSAKVVKISNGTAVIDAGGAKREVSAQLLEDLEPGDYVMVHAGVAIAKITEEDDSETEHLMEEFLS
jgi:hydrogenase assembly chaperone hypC/hupF